MIEEVKTLEANAERSAFPTRNSRTLHDCEIGIEIMRSAKAIAPLAEGYCWAVAYADGAQTPNIKSDFATRLHKKSIRAGRDPVATKLTCPLAELLRVFGSGVLAETDAVSLTST